MSEGTDPDLERRGDKLRRPGSLNQSASHLNKPSISSRTSLKESERRLAVLNFERGQAACEKGEIGPGLLRLVESWRSAVAADDPGWRHTARASLSAWQAPSRRTQGRFLPCRGGLLRRLQPGRQDRADRELGRDGAAVGRGDGPAPRAAHAPSGGHGRGVQPGRQDRADRGRGRDGAAVGRGDRPAPRAPAGPSGPGSMPWCSARTARPC